MFQSQTRSQSPGDIVLCLIVALLIHGFNRRREANPLATEKADPNIAVVVAVSIADAKPIPWRRLLPVASL